jgi:hypothetical protein
MAGLPSNGYSRYETAYRGGSGDQGAGMDWDRQQARAAMLCEELAEELAKFDRDRLRRLCRETGRLRVLQHISEHRASMLDFLEMTPAKRTAVMRRLAPDPDNEAMYLLCVLHLARCGRDLLQAGHRMETEDWRGTPRNRNRRLLRCGADETVRLLAGWPDVWPFEDGPDPFDETPSDGK